MKNAQTCELSYYKISQAQKQNENNTNTTNINTNELKQNISQDQVAHDGEIIKLFSPINVWRQGGHVHFVSFCKSLLRPCPLLANIDWRIPLHDFRCFYALCDLIINIIHGYGQKPLPCRCRALCFTSCLALFVLHTL